METTRRGFIFGTTASVAAASFLPVDLLAEDQLKMLDVTTGSPQFMQASLVKGGILKRIPSMVMASETFKPAQYRLMVMSSKKDEDRNPIPVSRIIGAEVEGIVLPGLVGVQIGATRRLYLPHEDGSVTIGDFRVDSLLGTPSTFDRLRETRAPLVLGGEPPKSIVRGRRRS
jgi:hypothetical protein